MTISIQRADLARTLAAVTKVVESRQVIPILANVLLSATAGTLTVTGTDLDIQYSAMTSCEGELSTTVDAKRLSDIARRLSGDTVTMYAEDDKLVVKSGRSKFTLPTLHSDDFPLLDGGVFDAEFKVDLAALVAPVKFAMSSQEARYYLCGVNLHVEGDTALRAVATDGHRLAHNSVALPEGIDNSFNEIVPAKTVGLIPAGIIDVGLSKNKIRIATADTIIVSKLIDGVFPDYKRVIPAGNDRALTVDKKDFEAAIARVSTISSDRGRAVKLSISSGAIVLSSSNPDAGSATDEVECDYDGPDMEIGFNSQYLGDVLGALTGETVTVKLSEAGSPGIFTGDSDVLALCMPMRC
jgi:DNA polymerase-3 subunit beta